MRYFYTTKPKIYYKDMDLNIIEELWNVLQDRKTNPRKGSYTNKLLEDEEKIFEKLKEELGEVEEAARMNRLGDEKDSLSWEVSDLIYHLLVLLTAKGVGVDQVLKELKRRR
jgi:phosphoribosyl-ATP pyrophosphohydrolase